MCLAAGTLIGPIVGGELVDILGYRGMTNYCCLIALVMTCAHFLFIIVPDWYDSPKETESHMNAR